MPSDWYYDWGTDRPIGQQELARKSYEDVRRILNDLPPELRQKMADEHPKTIFGDEVPPRAVQISGIAFIVLATAAVLFAPAPFADANLNVKLFMGVGCLFPPCLGLVVRHLLIRQILTPRMGVRGIFGGMVMMVGASAAIRVGWVSGDDIGLMYTSLLLSTLVGTCCLAVVHMRLKGYFAGN
jgi:hypothetical protein